MTEQRQPNLPHIDPEMTREMIDAAHNVVGDGRVWHPVEFNPIVITTALERELISQRAENATTLQDSAAANKEKDEHIERLEEEAITDEMTGLRTFHALKRELPQAVALSMREKTGFLLWALDGVALGEVNNHVSRTAGDEYIQAIARSLEASIRKSEAAYRGGAKADEFFVMMPLLHIPKDKIDEFIFKKQAEFEDQLALRLEENPKLKPVIEELGLGVYIGQSYIDLADLSSSRRRKPTELAHDLIEEADEELRRAKQREKKFQSSETPH